MSTSEIIIFTFVVLLSVVSLIIACFQFKERGFLFNNAYIYASKKERDAMNKKPYYRQSAIAFGAIGVMLIIAAAAMLTGQSWLFTLVIILSGLLVAYAVISSVIIEKKRK